MRSAHQQFRDCVALARAQGFGRLEVANLSMVGWSGLYLAEIADAAAVGREAIALAQQASQPRAELMGRGLVAWADGVIRDRRDEAEEQTAAALQLIRALGARRFEAQMLAVNALLALRRGDHARGIALAEESLDICRAHGMGHIGPWAFGVRALLEPDPAARLRFLDEGERQLTLGCVSHNHVQLRELAIDALLEIGDWDGVAHRIDLRKLHGGQFLGLLHHDRLALGVVHRFLGLAGVVEGHAGTGGDQPADDDVFLQPAQLVALAHDRRLGQHARRFLERCGTR